MNKRTIAHSVKIKNRNLLSVAFVNLVTLIAGFSSIAGRLQWSVGHDGTNLVLAWLRFPTWGVVICFGH